MTVYLPTWENLIVCIVLLVLCCVVIIMVTATLVDKFIVQRRRRREYMERAWECQVMTAVHSLVNVVEGGYEAETVTANLQLLVQAYRSK